MVDGKISPDTTSDDQILCPYMPDRLDYFLFFISFGFVLDRHSTTSLLPVQLGLIADIIPPECLIWSILILKFAARDVVHTYWTWRRH